MKTLYIPSLQSFSGKTAICLALGKRFQRDGHRVGYFKPLSTQAWEPVPGTAPDEDADFVRRALGLSEPTEALVGIVLTPSLLRDILCGCINRDLLAEVRAAFGRVAMDKDIVLVEGGASLREGVGIGLGPADVAEALDASILAVIPFINEMSLVDDCAAARLRLGHRLLGVVMNGVPAESTDFVQKIARPCLEERGLSVFGVIPREERLRAITVGEIAQVLGAEFLVAPEKRDTLVENLVVGAMSVDQALPRIRRVPAPKAVITGGDRADIHWAALETGATCLILTGHLRPQPEILRRAEELNVPILLVRQNTMETVEAIDRVFGKTRLNQPEKLARFEALLAEHFDFGRIYRALGLAPSA
ncbi:MAG: phosphotransacetylase family protein [Anaerolineae bacterium]|nr:phosphotransacetylase family protein [Anaerolineae bacterium]MDW7991474.1 phosphotransacetylase family protein [Anaerolineae bacterium]